MPTDKFASLAFPFRIQTVRDSHLFSFKSSLLSLWTWSQAVVASLCPVAHPCTRVGCSCATAQLLASKRCYHICGPSTKFGLQMSNYAICFVGHSDCFKDIRLTSLEGRLACFELRSALPSRHQGSNGNTCSTVSTPCTLASLLLGADVLVGNATPVNNVAVQWNALANRLYCQSSGLVFEPNIILAQLSLAQLHAILALKGSGTGQEAAVAYASHAILSNYYNFQQDLSLDPLLANQLKALNLTRCAKESL